MTKKLKFPLQEDSVNWLSEDFISIDFVSHNIPNLEEGSILVFTSKNAVKSLFHFHARIRLDDYLVICVGDKTEKELTNHKVEVNHVLSSSSELGEWIVNEKLNKPVIHFCGNIRRDELKEITENNQINYSDVVVYKTTLTPVKIKEDLSGVLFFSPSGVKSYLQENKSGNLVAFCIGNTTAKEAKKHFSKVEVSDDLTIESVIEKVNKYYANK